MEIDPEVDLHFLSSPVRKPKHKWVLRHIQDELERGQSNQGLSLIQIDDGNQPSTSGVSNHTEPMDVVDGGVPQPLSDDDDETRIFQDALDMEFERIMLDSPFNRLGGDNFPNVSVEDAVSDQEDAAAQSDSDGTEDEVEPQPPYYTPPDDGFCLLDRLPDEIIVHIITFVGTKNLVSAVCRVSRRWNRLSKDLSSRLNVDIGFTCLKPKPLLKAIKLLGRPCHTKRLAVRSPITENISKRRRSERCTATKSLGVAIIKEINKYEKLQHLSITHEHIFKLDLCQVLKCKLTHLSFPYCNISHQKFNEILSGCGTLGNLEYLDLTGVLVINRYSIDKSKELPNKLKTLKLKDTGRLFDSIFEPISKHTSLALLDIGLCRVSLEALDTISVTLVHLTSLNMAGCYVGDYGESGLEESWSQLWTNRFPSLRRLNVRNCQNPSMMRDNRELAPMSSIEGSDRFSWLIDVDGTRSLCVQAYEDIEEEEEEQSKESKPSLDRYLRA